MIAGMEKVQGVNPKRIAWCCEDQGISLEELSLRTGIAQATLEKAMKGQDVLTIKQLQKIAAFFSRGLLFFLEEEPVKEASVHSVQFRTLSNQKPFLTPRIRALVERTERQRAIYVSLLEDLGESVDQPWYPTHLQIDEREVKQAASLTRNWLGLAEGQDFQSIRDTVEGRNLLVFLSNSYAGPWQIEKDNPIRGFSLYYPSFPVIMVKKQVSKGAQAFTLMHELGHMLLHRESFVDDENDFFSHQGKEQAANQFAGFLLVPDEFLEKINLRAFPLDEVTDYDAYLHDYCRRWCVSPEVILRRLVDEGWLPREAYHCYRQWKLSLPAPADSGSGARYRFKEPVRVFGHRFVNTVLDSLHEQRITLTRASSYLDNLKIKDLRRLEDTHALI